MSSPPWATSHEGAEAMARADAQLRPVLVLKFVEACALIHTLTSCVRHRVALEPLKAHRWFLRVENRVETLSAGSLLMDGSGKALRAVR